MNIRRHAAGVAMAALAAVICFTACSKSGNSNTAQSKMVYTGSTDTSTGGAAATPDADGAGKVLAGDPAHGKQIFTQNCAQCHGATGTEGGVGPSLKSEKSRKDTAAAVAWIKNPQAPMPKLYPSPLDEKDVADVAAYVESL